MHIVTMSQLLLVVIVSQTFLVFDGLDYFEGYWLGICRIPLS